MSKKNSFSLIEVIFACTLLIMFLVAGMIIFYNSAKTLISSKHRLQAIYLANQTIEEKTAERDDKFFDGEMDFLPSLGITTQSIDDFNRTTDISSGPFADTVTIKVEVSWTDFGEGQKITMYKYLTKWQN